MTLINFPVSKYLINELPGNGWPASGTHTYNGYGYTHYAADSLSGASIPAGFPSNPTNGAKHIYQYRTYEFQTDTWTSPEIWAINISTVYSVVGGATYMWDGEKWTASNIPDSSNAIHVAPSTLNANEYLKWTGTEWTGEDGVGAQGDDGPTGPPGPTGPAGPIGGIQLTYKSSTIGLSHGEFGFTSSGNTHTCVVKIVPANDTNYVLANVIDTITNTNDSDNKTYVMLHEGNAWVDAFWIKTIATVNVTEQTHSFEVGQVPSLTNDTSYYWLLNMQGDTGQKGDQGNVGNTGQDGDDGAQIYYQDESPGNTVGNVGDLWIDSDSTNKTLHRKDAVDAAWVEKFDIKGQAGQNGTNGTNGQDGSDGLAGLKLTYDNTYNSVGDGEFGILYESSEASYRYRLRGSSVAIIKDFIYNQYNNSNLDPYKRLLFMFFSTDGTLVHSSWMTGQHYFWTENTNNLDISLANDEWTPTYGEDYYIQISVPGENGTNGNDGNDGTGWTGGSYNSSNGEVTFTSDDGLEFTTGDLRGANGSGWNSVLAEEMVNKTLKNYSEKGASVGAQGSSAYSYTCESSQFHLYQLDFNISNNQTVVVDIGADYQSMTIAIDTHGEPCTFELPSGSSLTGIEWVGGSAPSINTTNKYAVLEFFRLQGVVFGCKVGDFS